MPGLKTPNSVHPTEKVPHSAVVFYQVTKVSLMKNFGNVYHLKSIFFAGNLFITYFSTYTFEITLIMEDPINKVQFQQQ